MLEIKVSVQESPTVLGKKPRPYKVRPHLKTFFVDHFCVGSPLTKAMVKYKKIRDYYDGVVCAALERGVCLRGSGASLKIVGVSFKSFREGPYLISFNCDLVNNLYVGCAITVSLEISREEGINTWGTITRHETWNVSNTHFLESVMFVFLEALACHFAGISTEGVELTNVMPEKTLEAIREFYYTGKPSNGVLPTEM